MKTLFWTGSACSSWYHGQARVWRWFYYYQLHKSLLDVTHWAIFNNGGENLPLEIWVHKHDGSQPIPELEQKRLHCIWHQPEILRQDCWNFDGFWRNLQSAIAVAKAQFDRFILIEGDVLILNHDMLKEIGQTTQGLVTYYCPTYNIPESAIVICGKDQYDRLDYQVGRIRAKHGQCTEADRFEVAVDWTEVRKHRKGDRYAETGLVVPADAHYACQMNPWVLLQNGGVIEAFL